MPNSNIQSYKDLVVWKKSIDLVVSVYGLTGLLPKAEQYGLISQMNRAAVSIPSNIAEGKRRANKKEFLQFLMIAFSSGAELETQIEIVKRLDFGKTLDFEKIDMLLGEVMKMLNILTRNLRD